MERKIRLLRFRRDIWIALLALAIITCLYGFLWYLIPFYVLVLLPVAGDTFLKLRAAARRNKQKP
jgi:hypothetical protein